LKTAFCASVALAALSLTCIDVLKSVPHQVVQS
jgi:hypothetical protein